MQISLNSTSQMCMYVLGCHLSPPKCHLANTIPKCIDLRAATFHVAGFQTMSKETLGLQVYPQHARLWHMMMIGDSMKNNFPLFTLFTASFMLCKFVMHIF